jgi:hypothetical protein
MDREVANRLSCAVCGIETKRHAGWFLVMDNCWLDRVKVLSWHPVLAREGRIRGVCGQLHLKRLLTHWLNHGNLQLLASGAAPWPIALDDTLAKSSYARFSVGRVVGELAVERDSSSPVWTGSPEAMECILDALIGGTEMPPRRPEATSLKRWVGYSRDYAFH